MRLVVDDAAFKDLAKITKKDAAMIVAKIKTLAQYPQVSSVKKLTNFHPNYRLRAGNYRVLFDVARDVITVLAVKHRKDVYRKK